MRKWKKLSKFIGIAAAAAFIPAIMGCGASSEKTDIKKAAPAAVSDQENELWDYRTVVDEYASLYLPMDEDGYLYETALDAVGDYLSGKMDAGEALGMVEDITVRLNERLAGIADYAADTDFDGLLEENGIIPEEFAAFANCRAVYLQSYVTDLETLTVYLGDADVNEYDYEQVVFWHDLLEAILEAEKGYYYYGCLNYWFADWEEDQLTYINEQVTDNLRSYISDGFYWETDQNVVEQNAMRYLDMVEEYVSLETEHLAQTQEDYAILRKETEELEELIAAQRELYELEEQLRKTEEIGARIRELSEQISAAKDAGDEEEMERLREEFEEVVAEYYEITGSEE